MICFIGITVENANYEIFRRATLLANPFGVGVTCQASRVVPIAEVLGTVALVQPQTRHKAPGTRSRHKRRECVMDWCHRNSDGIWNYQGLMKAQTSLQSPIQRIRLRASSQLFESTASASSGGYA